MIVKRSSKKEISKVSEKKESNYDRVRREYLEQEAIAKAEKEREEMEAKKEYDRKKSIIIPYLDKLQKKIEDKDLYNFWVLSEDKKFKKHSGTIIDVKNILKKYPERYAGKRIFCITMHFNQHEEDTSWHRRGDTWFGLDIYGFMVGKNGEMQSTKEVGGNIVWKTNDFAITKFSFKLLAEITRIMEMKKIHVPNMVGFSLFDILTDIFRRRKIAVSKDVLNPLEGICI